MQNDNFRFTLYFLIWFQVFQAFGGIVDIIAMKSLRRRGQAWIIFEKGSASTKALESLQGFPLYNKPMRTISNKHLLINKQAYHKNINML